MLRKWQHFASVSRLGRGEPIFSFQFFQSSPALARFSGRGREKGLTSDAPRLYEEEAASCRFTMSNLQIPAKAEIQSPR